MDVIADNINRSLEDKLEDAPVEIQILDKMIAESSEFKELSASLGGLTSGISFILIHLNFKMKECFSGFLKRINLII